MAPVVIALASGSSTAVLGMLVAASACLPVTAGPADDLSPAMLRRELSAVRDAMGLLVDADDPIDTLYFGWFDRPYRRATLACAVKTANALDRELNLRQAGNGALSDEEVRAILAWVRSAIERARQPARRVGFYPHRRARSRPGAGRAGCRFGFVDRSTVSRLDDWYGDFDLLASCGFRAYARSDRPYLNAAGWASLLRHADALGVTVVTFGGTRGESAGPTTAPPPPEIRALTLHELFDFDPAAMNAEQTVAAVLDPTRAESWAESLARRGLYRGVLPRHDVTVCGWAVPGVGRADAASGPAVQAAMWAHACDGQSLGLLEGWRDLRDGSLSPYASLVVSPGFVETVAHVDLDLLFHRDALRGFATRPDVVLVVDDAALDPSDPNRWSVSFARLLEALNPALVPVDVLPSSEPGWRERIQSYALAVDLTGALNFGAGNAAAGRTAAGGAGLGGVVGGPTAWKLYQRGTAIDDPPQPGESMVAWFDRLRLRAASGRRGRIVDAQGGYPADVFARWGWHDNAVSRLALVNLSDRPIRVWPFDGPQRLTGPVIDVVAATRLTDIANGIPLAPWQVRLLRFGQANK